MLGVQGLGRGRGRLGVIARCDLSSIARTPSTWTRLTIGPWPGEPTWMPVPFIDQLLVIFPVASVSAT